MKSQCRRTQTWMIFFLSAALALSLSFAQPEYILHQTDSYATGLNVSCFDWYNGTVFISATNSQYIYLLDFPPTWMAPRTAQSLDVNCVDAMPDGRIMYSTPKQVYQMIPVLGEPFNFINVKDIRSYKDGFIILTGYNSIRGTQGYGNMTKGPSFAYAGINFTGIGTDGESIYASMNESSVVAFNASFSETGRIQFCNCSINGLSVYGSGPSAIMAVPAGTGTYLRVGSKNFFSSSSLFDRCVIANSSLVICSRNSTIYFMEIVNVSEKAREYVRLATEIQKYILNATGDEYAAWASQQLARAEALKETNIVTALDIAQNISLGNLQEAAERLALQRQANSTGNISNATSNPQLPSPQETGIRLGLLTMILIGAAVAIAGILAYYMLVEGSRAKKPKAKAG